MKWKFSLVTLNIIPNLILKCTVSYVIKILTGKSQKLCDSPVSIMPRFGQNDWSSTPGKGKNYIRFTPTPRLPLGPIQPPNQGALSLGVMWLGYKAESLVPRLRAPHLHDILLKQREGQLYVTPTLKEGHFHLQHQHSLKKRTIILFPNIPEKEGTNRNRYYVMLCLVTLPAAVNRYRIFTLLQTLSYNNWHMLISASVYLTSINCKGYCVVNL